VTPCKHLQPCLFFLGVRNGSIDIYYCLIRLLFSYEAQFVLCFIVLNPHLLTGDLLLQWLYRGIPRAHVVVVRSKVLHLLLRQLKVEDPCVLHDTGGSDALDERHESSLQTPSQQDLRLRLAVLLGQGHRLGLAEALATDDGAVGLDGDIASVRPLYDVRTGEPGVDLPLANRDDTALAWAASGRLELLDVRLQLVQVVDAEVGHADRADLAGLDGLNEGEPGPLSALRTRAVRPVDEDQVEVAELSLLEGRVYELLSSVIAYNLALDGKLCREEDLLSRDACLGDSSSCLCLVVVCRGGIDLPSTVSI
jgi:hypothetical protein